MIHWSIRMQVLGSGNANGRSSQCDYASSTQLDSTSITAVMASWFSLILKGREGTRSWCGMEDSSFLRGKRSRYKKARLLGLAASRDHELDPVGTHEWA